MQRRHFLISAGATVASIGALGIGSSLFRTTRSGHIPDKGYLLGEGHRESPLDPSKGKRSRRLSLPGAMTLMGHSGEVAQRWKTPFYPHGLEQSPSQKNLITGVQKMGPYMAAVDVRDAASVRVVTAPDNLDFFGHGIFIANGALFAATAMNQEAQTGQVLIFETKDFKHLQTFEIDGHSPHELQLDLNNPDLLIVATSGGQFNTKKQRDLAGENRSDVNHDTPKMIWMNWKTGKIEHECYSFSSDSLVPGHFRQLEGGSVLVYGDSTRRKRNAGLGIARKDDTWMHVLSKDWPASYEGECLNSFVDAKNNRTWLAIPDGDVIVVVKSDSYETIAELPLSLPRSFTLLDEDLLLISSMSKDSAEQVPFSLSQIRKLGQNEARDISHDVVFSPVYSAHSTPFTKA